MSCTYAKKLLFFKRLRREGTRFRKRRRNHIPNHTLHDPSRIFQMHRQREPLRCSLSRLAIKIRDISICPSPPRNPVFYCCSLLYNISFDLSTSKFLTFDKIRQNPTRFSKFSDAMHSLEKRCVKLCAVLPLCFDCTTSVFQNE